MVFHLTSRLHRSDRLFVPELRSEVTRLIIRLVARTDARLLGFAVMPSHLHLLVRQGRSDLKTLMQPLLRCVAHRVHKHHGLAGTVFERRYRDRLCENPDHIREALVYIHLNPVRAGLCRHADEYPWTSHRAYLPGSDPVPFGIPIADRDRMLELFAYYTGRDRDDQCRDYMEWMKARAGQVDDADPEDPLPGSWPAPRRPLAHHALSTAWEPFDPAAHMTDQAARAAPPLLDLRDFVGTQLARFSTPCRLEDLCGSYLPRARARNRAAIIHAAAQRGYRTLELARFFRISPSTVSAARHGPGTGTP